MPTDFASLRTTIADVVREVLVGLLPSRTDNVDNNNCVAAFSQPQQFEGRTTATEAFQSEINNMPVFFR